MNRVREGDLGENGTTEPTESGFAKRQRKCGGEVLSDVGREEVSELNFSSTCRRRNRALGFVLLGRRGDFAACTNGQSLELLL